MFYAVGFVAERDVDFAGLMIINSLGTKIIILLPNATK